ncbi:MAG: hypothetical protein ACI90V_002106, partial [Bacillariaceae sp.]
VVDSNISPLFGFMNDCRTHIIFNTLDGPHHTPEAITP